MDIGQYENRRKELVGYIDEALGLSRIPDKMQETLASVRKKVYENQFRIVLISGFEAGKSTTFNALCDGQEISPRGAMLRTSATVISAQNTMDDSLVGKAMVFWRSDKDLTLIFSKYLLQTLKQLEKKRFAGFNQSDQLTDELHYPEDIRLLRQAVAQRQKELASMTDDEVPVEEEEALRMARIICEYYESPLIQQIKMMHSFSVKDVEKMVCFPANWSHPWLEQKTVPFRPEDCIFLFVKEAYVYIKSKNLMRTGCVLIDCPGLFASNYDTRVAFDILENADAVWYILNGIGMGQSDIDCAKRLVTAKPNRIFYTVNIQNNTINNVMNRIVPSYVSTFKRLKVNLKNADFMAYHALLALVAIQADKYLSGTLDTHSKKAICELADRFGTNYESIEDILNTWVENALCNVFGYTVRQLKTFNLFAADHSGIDLIAKECGLEKILNTIENSVVHQKAYSILVENGSRKAVELLQQLEANLLIEESLASETEDKMEAEFDAAQKSLDDFQTFCDTELDDLRDTSVDHTLALDYWQEVIISSIDEVAHKSARKIASLNCNEVRQDENEQIINDTFSEIVLPKATAWADSIRNGNNVTFSALIVNRISKIIKNTNKQWKLTIQDQPMLLGLPVPTPIIGTDVIATEFIDSIIAKTPGVSSEVVTGAATCMAIGILLGSFIFPGLGTVLGGAIGGAIGALLGNGVGTERREKIIYDAIKEELYKNVVFSEQAVSSSGNTVIEKQKKRIKALRIGIIKAFESAFDDTKKAFSNRQTRAYQMFRLQSQQREKLAAEHKKLRVEKIEPLRQKIQAFETMVKANCRSGGCE